MRKHLVLGLSLMLVLVTAIAASAKTSDSKAKYHRVHGTVDSVDATAQSFVVKHGNSTSTFKTDSSTKFKGAGKDITFGDIKVGDKIRVSYTESGSDKTASRVDVTHGPAAPPPANPS
ncbi:MAG TPA: DUF5666 domain-containing protein [Thermoanaerobaculia bacterium]|nr:DUF5666 domain-containing protein [Thermoanaerobaculia bacterium]